MGKYAPQTLFDAPTKYPISITIEEYQSEWKPKGWNIIFIGPTATWRQEWGAWEAIRDIVQNCLDETEAYGYQFDQTGLRISDHGKGVAVDDFLLGPPKLKPDWARGKFGEGMKIAALALLRLGHPVHITTVGRELWMVFADQPVNGRVKTLAALWRPNGAQVGTTFHIIGYKGSLFAERFAVNLPKRAFLFQAASNLTQPKLRWNQLIDTNYTSGESYLYCRDIFLKTIKSPFSYNLWGFELAPDRHGPMYEHQVWEDAAQLWAMCDRVPLLTKLLKVLMDPPIGGETDETTRLEFSMLGTDPVTKAKRSDIWKGNAKSWKQAWKHIVGEGCVLETDPGLANLVAHLGYSTRKVTFSARRLSAVLPTDVELIDTMREKLKGTDIIPDEVLTERERNHLELARAIAKDFGVKVVDAAHIPPASDRITRTAGFYDKVTKAVKINRTELHWGSNTIATLTHELGHHLGYTRGMEADDLTRAHRDACEEVTGRIVAGTAQGKYDHYADKVIWGV